MISKIARSFQELRPGCGARAFFLSVLIWGVGIGCFYAALNNYLVEIHHVDELERGWLEFFRELPGLGLVFVLALLHRASEWKILRIGTLISLAGVIGLLIPADLIALTLLIMIWSTGEHLVMPVRSSIAMHVAKPGHGGSSLGLVTSAMNAGTVVGSVLVALIFQFGLKVFHWDRPEALYNIVWVLIALLIAASFLCLARHRDTRFEAKRPRLFFALKYHKYYALELFYGARKQIFLTFAPYVLIKIYGLSTAEMALLAGTCAAVNIFGAPLIGKITDRIGYRNVMIYDTVLLFVVCLTYGYAGQWFAPAVAVWVVCFNFLLDAVISTASMASNLYVRSISDNKEELTSTLSTGISINHMISVTAAPLGGWIWQRYGVETLFLFAAVMALANSLYALTIPRPTHRQA